MGATCSKSSEAAGGAGDFTNLSEAAVDAELARLGGRFAAAGQGHVVRWAAELPLDGKRRLLRSMAAVGDVDAVNDAFQNTMRERREAQAAEEARRSIEDDAKSPIRVLSTGVDGLLRAAGVLAAKRRASEEKAAAAPVDERLTPFDKTYVLADTDAATARGWTNAGLDAIAAGRCACLLMAGGQGTRLGSADPKGCYVIGTPSGHSLFQMQAERILRLRAIAASRAGLNKLPRLHWYILTSHFTHDATIAFFEEHDYFGLGKEGVSFFSQGMLPCFDTEGRMLLSSRDELALAPNGNGGLFAALAMARVPVDKRRRGQPGVPTRTVLDDMVATGVDFVHVYGVDNALVRVCDPVQVGLAVTADADCANKVVVKEDPDEKVGVMCLRGGKPAVVEYSDLPPSLARARNADGTLQLNAANIANHMYATRFLVQMRERIGLGGGKGSAETGAQRAMPYHIADKKIPHVGEHGELVVPTVNNGVKLEMFVFDAFPLAERDVVCLAVDRAAQFSPVKNKSGPGVASSPETAAEAISVLHKQMATAAGATITGDGKFEISALVTYAGEGLKSVCKKKSFATPYYLAPP